MILHSCTVVTYAYSTDHAFAHARIVVEAAFPRMKRQSSPDGVDLALFDLRPGRLRFGEVRLHNSTAPGPA